MPTRMQLEILTHTERFAKRFKVAASTGEYICYQNIGYNTFAVVTVYRTSAKCYRVMGYSSRSSVRKSSFYKSFRSLSALCVFLDDFNDFYN